MTIGYYLQGLARYADFEGRAGRAEFWWFNLVLYGIQFTIALLGTLLGTLSAPFETVATVMLWVHGLATALPQLAVAVRRLHDTGRNGWWLLLIMVPIFGWIPLLIFSIIPGDVGRNRYGRNPGNAGAAPPDRA